MPPLFYAVGVADAFCECTQKGTALSSNWANIPPMSMSQFADDLSTSFLLEFPSDRYKYEMQVYTL